MLDIKFVRSNIDKVMDMLNHRGYDLNISGFQALDEKRRSVLTNLEKLRYRRNTVTDKIAVMRKNGEDAKTLISEMKDVSKTIKEIEADLPGIEDELNKLLMFIPNFPHESVVAGKDSDDNPVVKEWGDIKDFNFEPLQHWEIGERLNILDFSRAAKITRSRFSLQKGLGARLERALINFMLDIHTNKHHYTEILPPFLVNTDSMTGTGQLPKFSEELFKVEGWDLFLIPTAEVPVTNIHRNEILSFDELPIKYVSYTPCFRSEAGSYGKDTRGLIRQHQFNKVELVKFCRPEDSDQELELLTADAEEILQRLGLPYRVVSLCTGDLGFSSAKTYDIEVWLPGQRLFREISSCSIFTDFQARRANIRFRRKKGKGNEFVHTLNGSGLAVGRTLVAILENYQQSDGSVIIPEELTPYMDDISIVKPG
ncbi:MAG: serine--tRNA ligase [Thermodesulfobacteriota bacterium]|nr:serine--tRNA ligase [Thermodesulfobacteriota bacterium]